MKIDVLIAKLQLAKAEYPKVTDVIIKGSEWDTAVDEVEVQFTTHIPDNPADYRNREWDVYTKPVVVLS